jgi:Fe-S cluster assembly protein SufB
MGGVLAHLPSPSPKSKTAERVSGTDSDADSDAGFQEYVRSKNYSRCCRYHGRILPLHTGNLKTASRLWPRYEIEGAMATQDKIIEEFANREYEHGFVTDVEQDTLPPGLDEDVIRFISAKKEEPEWLLEWRLNAYRHWLELSEPRWPNVSYPEIDYKAISYFAAPKKAELESLDEVDPEILSTYKKLGIPLEEQKILAGVAVDAVFDSVSVATTFKEKLGELGIIFCSFSEAVREHPELVKKYLGSVVPTTDNFFATLNSAVFSDGSFVYIPKGVRCPMELSTYFRINAANTGQFERTLIVADEGAYVSYLEGCTAPMRDENQLHAAVVELVALEDATIKYSTVQNWYPGDKETGQGGIFNFVTKRGICKGDRAKISWTQVETGSAITWKYPSVILKGDDTVGEFYSVALTAGRQQADTGSKMIHLGNNTSSTIISKGISASRGQNTYRGQVKVGKKAADARNFSQCDSMLIGDRCGAHTFPYIEIANPSAQMEHEATTSKIGEDQIFYCNQRGIETEDAVSMIVNGFCKEVFRELPMEFAVEAQKLLGVSLEGSVG